MILSITHERIYGHWIVLLSCSSTTYTIYEPYEGVIVEVLKDKILDGVSDLRDESTEDTRIVIELIDRTKQNTKMLDLCSIAPRRIPPSMNLVIMV